MRESLLVKLLPPPDFLSMPTFGVDISDQDIRMVCLEESSRGLKIKTITEHLLPEGIVVGGRVEKPAELARLFGDLAKAFGVRYATWSLPEDLAYIVTMSLPAAAKSNLRESIELQLEEYVPVKIDEVSFDVDILNMPNKKRPTFEVVVGVAAKRDVEDCLTVCRQAGVTLRSLEVESQSLARVLIKKDDLGTYMIVDFGKRRVSFAVVTGGVVSLTLSVPSLGGDALTKAIQRGSKISYEEAEKLKVKNGLTNLDKNSDLFFTVMSHLGSLRDEITSRIEYWQTKKDDGVSAEPITKIILCGGQASLPGLFDYLSESLAVPVEIGNPWINVVDFNRSAPPLNKTESLHFAKAIGLALRNLAYGH